MAGEGFRTGSTGARMRASSIAARLPSGKPGAIADGTTDLGQGVYVC